jgi:hypothetical protein
MGGSREIEIERVVGLSSAYTLQLIMDTHLSEVVELKDEFLGEVIDPSPDNPSNTNGTLNQLHPSLHH